MDFTPDATGGPYLSARVAAQRSTLVRVQVPACSDSVDGGEPTAFLSRTEASPAIGLVPRLDAGLDSGHRFAMLGAIFRPMRQFLRRTFDGDDEAALSNESDVSLQR
ncbi:MAG: hypothetical protein AAEJ04_01875 [Planctomycetota bacterium]